MSGIFVSYRRPDTGPVAARLHGQLSSRFGPGKVVIDVESFGGDHGQRIEEAVGSCHAFLALIGHRWLVDRNPPGKRAVGIPRDWVLKEIEAALARPEGLVVPVLVEAAAMPGDLELPYSVRSLARLRAMPLTEERWDDQVRQIAELVEEPTQALGPGAPQPPAQAPEAPPRRRRFRR